MVHSFPTRRSSELRAGHAEHVAQHPQERGVAVDIDHPIDAVDLDCGGHSHLHAIRVPDTNVIYRVRPRRCFQRLFFAEPLLMLRPTTPSNSHCTGVSANRFGRVLPTISPTSSMTLSFSIRRIVISDSTGCDTQMPSSVTANLLDDGVVDTLVSVGATSSVHTSVSINASDSARIPRAAHRRPALREACQQTRVTDDDGNRLQRYGWRGTSGNCRMSSSVPLFSRTPPSRPQADTKV